MLTCPHLVTVYPKTKHIFCLSTSTLKVKMNKQQQQIGVWEGWWGVCILHKRNFITREDMCDENSMH